jgi:hypothetical protein
MKQEELNKKLELHIKWLNNEEGGIRLDLRGADLQRANLQRADLQLTHLQRADLRGADLQHTDLQRADLQLAHLQRADLQLAHLQRADLQLADLQRADLQRADLQRADLQRADLRGANLQRADLRGANIDFSCLPLWCGGLNFKIDEKQAKQLVYHVLNLMQYSELNTKKIFKKATYKWLEDSHLVTKHRLPVLKEEGRKRR